MRRSPLKALSQADLLPPCSLRPLYGYPTDFFAAIGKIVTSLLGLYKLGFTLGVGGIAYSAYSLVKVGRSLRCVPYTLLRTTTSRQGKN